MTRRERLMRTIRGESVDRPAVCFYEINGYTENPKNDDPFNIYSDPSWKPLIDLAAEKTDRIVNTGGIVVNHKVTNSNEVESKSETFYDENGSRFVRSHIRIAGRELTSLTRHDPDINTVWQVEHLLKDVNDLKAWLQLPVDEIDGEVDPKNVLKIEEDLDETGIVMLNTGDPLCSIAPLFDMAEYTIIAMTETELFHQALQKASVNLYKRTEMIAKALPGRLWRIYGPEYASPPYLPPSLFREYVTDYVKPMVDIIHKYGGYARIHSHGNLKAILDDIVDTGCMGLDPIEPPPQGDVELSYVRQNYGDQLVLFGNLEASDIENLPTDKFQQKIETAIAEGTAGEGRGFVLMPSACPYGRTLSSLAMKNYEKMVECIEKL